MTDYERLNESKRERLLELLSDRYWHDHTELRSVGGTRYSARLLELKRLGYVIEDASLKPQGKRYRLVSLKRGEPKSKRVKIYMDVADAEELLNGVLNDRARERVRSAVASFRANETKL